MILAKIYEKIGNKYQFGCEISDLYLKNYNNLDFIKNLIDFFKHVKEIDAGLQTLLMSLVNHHLIIDYLVVCELFECLERLTTRQYMTDFYNSIILRPEIAKDVELLEERLGFIL